MTMRKGAEDVAVFPKHVKLLLVCVNKTYKAEGAYNAARYSWKISPARAAQADYVLAVAHSVIVGVFEANEWMPARKSNFPKISNRHGNWGHQRDRFGFVGASVSGDIALFIDKRVPPEWGFRGNPIRYVNF